MQANKTDKNCATRPRILTTKHTKIKLNKLNKKNPNNKNVHNLLESILNKSDCIINKNNKIDTLIGNKFYDELETWIHNINFNNGLSNTQYTLSDKIKLESILGRKIKILCKDNGKFAKNIELEYKEDCYFGVVNLCKNNLEICLSTGNEITEKIELKYNSIFICRLDNKIINLNPNLSKIFLFM